LIEVLSLEFRIYFE